MIGTDYFSASGPFMHPHLQHIHPLISTQSWQRWSISWRSLSYHGQIDAQISTIILVKYARKILKSTRRSCKYLAIQNFPRKEMITLIHLAWDETISAATPLHCLSMGLLSNCQNLQKVGHDIVILQMAMYSVRAWHTWCKKGTNRKRMSCSSPICHMQIFKSFDFRTMGLWIWITYYFDTHCTTTLQDLLFETWSTCCLEAVWTLVVISDS